MRGDAEQAPAAEPNAAARAATSMLAAASYASVPALRTKDFTVFSPLPAERLKIAHDVLAGTITVRLSGCVVLALSWFS